jgi:hypothetical protein
MPRCITNVTFPRSGHHLLEKLLRNYWEDDFRYCEYYTHCRRTPCRDRDTNWQKNHEFDLKLARTPDRFYVVQYRHPFEAISSWYQWELNSGFLAEKNGELKSWLQRLFHFWPKLALMFEPDDRVRWERFLDEKLGFWRQFVEKWVLPGPADNMLLLPYGRLVADPRAVVFADPENAVDLERINSIVDERQIRRSRAYTEFRHFSPPKDREVEAQFLDILRTIEVPSLFHNA